jgi:hypothetical protein
MYSTRPSYACFAGITDVISHALRRLQKALTIATAGHVAQTSRSATFTTTRCARGPVISSVRRVKLLPKDLAYRVIWGIIWRMVDWMTAVR